MALDENDLPSIQEPPPRSRAVIIGAVALVAVAIAAYFVTRKTVEGALWVVNPTAQAATLDIDGATHTVEPGKVVELSVPADEALELGVAGEKISVTVADQKNEVTIVDLGKDAAYAVVDVSTYYGEKGAAEELPLLKVFEPAQVHKLPYPAARLVRPGRALPQKGSWELNVFKKPNAGVEMYKVFRVDPRRLEDKSRIAAMFREATASPNAASYENMQVAARTSTAPRTSIFDP